jgi:hypothetical protein
MRRRKLGATNEDVDVDAFSEVSAVKGSTAFFIARWWGSQFLR